MDMKKLIKQMTDIETSEKTKLNEAATISISAETGAEISDMIAAMQGNAGMQDKPTLSAPSLGMRGDMEKFRTAMGDDPEIPGKDDVEGDEDLKAGLLGTLAGGAAGAAIPGVGAALGGIGGLGGGALGGAIGGPAGAALGSKIGSAIGKAAPSAIGAKLGDKLTGEEVSDCNCDNDPCDCAEKEGYDNEPDAQYGDMSDAIPDGNDLNRKKKAYPATQDGDNPMAVETVKQRLMAALSEKKAKPDFLDMDKDGDKKEPMKKAIADKKAKKGTDESGQVKDCPKCGAPGKKKLMACSSCGCS